jgi:Methyltransferase domain
MGTIGRSASSATRLDIRTCGLLFLCTAGLLLNVCYRPDAAPFVGNLISAQMAVHAAAAAGHRRDESSPVTGGIPVNDGRKSLAYRQSFGFFHDISDDDWRRRQKRALDHRHQAWPSVKTVTASLEANHWYMKNYYPLFTCPDQQRVGIGGDGPKWVCDPHRLALSGQSSSGGAEGTTSGARCLVYSIGSNGNYGFEDGLVNLLGPGTCEIHVFDMSRDYTRRNDAENRKIFFHHWGLGSSYTDVGRAEGNTYLTLQETMQKLGHVNRTINIFKIDCEQCTRFPVLDLTVRVHDPEASSPSTDSLPSCVCR